MKIVLRSAREHYWLSPLIRGKLVMFLSPGECFVPGAPSRWIAPNGVVVEGNSSGWNGSFHEARYCPEGAYMVAKHRHLGPARHALRAFAGEFLGDRKLEELKLRVLVREND